MEESLFTPQPFRNSDDGDVKSKKEILDNSSSSNKNTSFVREDSERLIVVLNQEGGIPLYSKSFLIDAEGTLSDDDNSEEKIDASNENVILMSGLLEAILQLKGVVKPTITGMNDNKPLFIDVARAKNGVALVSLSTSDKYQHFPKKLLTGYLKTNQNIDLDAMQYLHTKLDKMLNYSLMSDPKTVLNKIKKELSELISFILVYDLDGNYLFSTAKNSESVDLVKNDIKKMITQEYNNGGKTLRPRYMDLIGLKRYNESIIWHFKVFNRIFVFFTYLMSEATEFETMKTDLLTFIANNAEQFINLSREMVLKSKDYRESVLDKTAEISTSRFIFIDK